MNWCRLRHGRSSVATTGCGYPDSIWTRSSRDQQSESAWSHRFTAGGNSTCKVGVTHDRHLQEIENQMTLTIWIYDAKPSSKSPVKLGWTVDRKENHTAAVCPNGW